MSSGDSDPGHYHSATAAAGFLEMFGDDTHGGDLFELVRQGGGGCTTMESSRPSAVPSFPLSPAVTPQPPSEDEMAAWLYPIVRGEELVSDQPGGNGDVAGGMAVDDQQVPAKQLRNKQLRESEKMENLLATEGKCAEGTTSESSERRKKAAGARRSHYSKTHSLAEKRRRCKVNERLKTLQQLVPGCDKSNQASTLDQTIEYVKSLQQHVQSMSVGCSMRPPAAAPVFYPAVPAPYFQPPAGTVAPRLPMPPAGAVASAGMIPVPMVPFAGQSMLPLIHRPAVMMPAPLIYPPAPAPTTTPAASTHHRRFSGSSKNKTSNLRHKE